MSDASRNRTQRILLRLVVFTTATGLWTAIFAVIELVLVSSAIVDSDAWQTSDRTYRDPELSQVLTTDTWFLVVGYPITSVYVNALLCNLNARDHISNVDEEPDSYELQTPISPRFVLRDVGGGLEDQQVRMFLFSCMHCANIHKNYLQSTIHIAPASHVSAGETKIHEELGHSPANVTHIQCLRDWSSTTFF